MSTSNPQPLKSVGLPDIDQILGLAVFDATGLPRDYFITPQHEDTEWVQLVFQSLGLQQLIASTMELPTFSHAMIRTKVGNIVLICCDRSYIAVLIKRALPQERPQIEEAWVDWIQDFEANVVRTHPNFRAV
ncbi:hypothetical protein Lepto7375DRAFT_5132 [Leptolyngbya sp. PCC 7375]|nr:hypothetical protein Lepto7375DRAFT_5132 [Leptolyngbya sp. PCC 7375]